MVKRERARYQKKKKGVRDDKRTKNVEYITPYPIFFLMVVFIGCSVNVPPFSFFCLFNLFSFSLFF